MARRGGILASGAVVLRDAKRGPEVLVVHRPAYDDWSLPKGKVGTDEYLAATAVREVREETGHRIRLLRPLSAGHYTVGGRPKTVQWWFGRLANNKVGGHDRETDLVEWWPVHRAVADLHYSDEVHALTEALRCPDTKPLLIVRHTKAMNRRRWHGDDADRRLTERGRRQARSLISLLDAFDVGLLASSSATRCMRTLAPYAHAKGLTVRPYKELSEEGAEANPAGVAKAMAELTRLASDADKPLAICGHRPVLPAMFDFLGVAPHHVLRPGEAVLTYPGETTNANQTIHIAPRL